MTATSPQKRSPFAFIKGIGFTGVLLALLLVGFGYWFGVVVPPGFIGVRQIDFSLFGLGPKAGFSDLGLKPGYHWTIPYYSRIHLVPQTVQLLNLHRDSSASDFTDLLIRTTDASSVDVDVTVLTRFYPESGSEGKVAHGGPAELLKNFGVDEARWRKAVRDEVSNKLLVELSSLAAQEFYNPEKREQRLAVAQAAAATSLARYGIKLEAILLRRYSYRDDKIDQAIFEKNIQEQEERLNEAATRLAEAKAKLEGEAAQGDARIQTLLVSGQNQVDILRSEANLYENQKRAEGDLAVAKARAEVDKLKATALAQSSGGDIYVARAMTPMLSALRGGVVSDVDPFDLASWIKRLGVGAHTEGREK